MVDLAQLKKSLKLKASLDDLRQLSDKVTALLEGLGDAEKYDMLLILERMVLGKVGHLCTIKFGKNRWFQQKCIICGVPLEQEEGQGFWFISRWENSSVMLCLCEACAQRSFEVDVDLLTGSFRSQVGEP